MIPSWLKVTLPCTKGAFPHIAHIFAKCKYYNFSCNEQNKKDINKEYSEKHNEQQLALLVPKLQVTLLPLVLPSQGQVLLLLHTMSPVRGSHFTSQLFSSTKKVFKIKSKRTKYVMMVHTLCSSCSAGKGRTLVKKEAFLFRTWSLPSD